MKKYTTLALALALCCSMLVGCGCMNSNAEVTVPTTVAPTAAPTTVPTEAPTTRPATEATVQPTDITGGTSETAGEDGMVDTAPADTAGGADAANGAKNRSGRNMIPMG